MVEWKRGDDKREDLEGGHSILRFRTIIRWGTARVSENQEGSLSFQQSVVK